MSVYPTGTHLQSDCVPLFHPSRFHPDPVPEPQSLRTLPRRKETGPVPTGLHVARCRHDDGVTDPTTSEAPSESKFSRGSDVPTRGERGTSGQGPPSHPGTDTRPVVP